MNATNAAPALGAMLRLSEVRKKTGMSCSTIYRWMNEGRFPKPLKLSDSCVRWPEAEIDDWLRHKSR